MKKENTPLLQVIDKNCTCFEFFEDKQGSIPCAYCRGDINQATDERAHHALQMELMGRTEAYADAVFNGKPLETIAEEFNKVGSLLRAMLAYEEMKRCRDQQ